MKFGIIAAVLVVLGALVGLMSCPYLVGTGSWPDALIGVFMCYFRLLAQFLLTILLIVLGLKKMF